MKSTVTHAWIFGAALMVGAAACDEKRNLGDEREGPTDQHPLSVGEASKVGDGPERGGPAMQPKRQSATLRARAELKAAEGAQLQGTVEFTEQASGVRVVVHVKQADPGKHGVHIHSKGDCSDMLGGSMGEHFAPQADPHALPSEAPPGERHLGDMGNIEVGEDGEGTLDYVIPNSTLKHADHNTLLDKAIVIHSGEDKGQAAQPAGGSGPPAACGVITQLSK